MTQFPRLSELAADYDAILCDVWGVIRDGSDLLPEALDALRGGEIHPAYDLGRDSSFIDVGSGYGKVVFHAALVARAHRARPRARASTRRDPSRRPGASRWR